MVLYVTFFGVVLVLGVLRAVFRGVAAQQVVLHCMLVVCFLGRCFLLTLATRDFCTGPANFCAQDGCLSRPSGLRFAAQLDNQWDT